MYSRICESHFVWVKPLAVKCKRALIYHYWLHAVLIYEVLDYLDIECI